MASSTFEERLDVLSALVGHEDLRGMVAFDQPYAAKQHVEQSYRHPRGGGPDYLTSALIATARVNTQNLAAHLLDGTLVDAMAENMEYLGKAASRLAPIDTGQLRGSDNPLVYVGHHKVYDRAPEFPREVQ